LYASLAEEKKKPPVFEGMGEAFSAFAPFLTLGIQLAVAVVVFFFIGNWVDQKYQTAPIGSLVGIALGSLGGFVKFFNSVRQLTKQDESRQPTPRED
jgi:F0F1-type ATP synthase assembly protein I